MTKTKRRSAPRQAARNDRRANDLAAVFDELKEIMSRHVPPFKEGGGQIREKREYHLLVPEPIVVAPNAYGGKPYQLAMASLILQKDFVGFYYAPVYMEPTVKKGMSRELLKLLKGKSCFHVRTLTLDVREGIRDALETGVKYFRKRQWV